MIDSLGKVPSSENEVGYLIHEELCQHPASSILVCPIQIVLQTILSEPHILLERLDPHSSRRNYETSLCSDRIFSLSSWESRTTAMSRLDFLLFWLPAMDVSVQVRKWEKEASELSLFWVEKFPNGLALVSRSCGNSGEASLPRSALSPASDASRAVARSSRVDSRLLLLESRTIGVASLLTSIGALGSQPVRGDCSANRPTNLKGKVVRRKSTCSVKLPWMVDQVVCGTWHASGVIFFKMTRTEMLQHKHVSRVRPWATCTSKICVCARMRGECTVYTLHRIQGNRHLL